MRPAPAEPFSPANLPPPRLPVVSPLLLAQLSIPYSCLSFKFAIQRRLLDAILPSLTIATARPEVKSATAAISSNTPEKAWGNWPAMRKSSVRSSLHVPASLTSLRMLLRSWTKRRLRISCAPRHPSLDHPRCDKGAEFVAGRVRQWLHRVERKTLFPELGNPGKTRYLESFNSKLGDELVQRRDV